MSKNKLIHIIRPRPVWATGKQMTVCGNVSASGDLSKDEMIEYVKSECRGSVKVAYGSCCVTCLDNSRDTGWKHRGRSDNFRHLFDYLDRSETRRHPEHGDHIEDEIEAIAELLERHNDEFRAIIQRRIDLRSYVKSGAKPKLVGGSDTNRP